MKTLLLFWLAWLPLRQESSLDLVVSCRTPEIFRNYRNYNFKQEIHPDLEGLLVKIKCQTLGMVNLNHVVGSAGSYLARQDPSVQAVFVQVRREAISIGDYLQNISLFLRNSITYAEDDQSQETTSVLRNRRAHCIGYANVAQTLLACAGIVSRPVNGFFLRLEQSLIEPVPHRWLEIDLPQGRQVFYDPQYQDFSARYLVTVPSVVFNRVEKFDGVVVKKNKKIMDE